MCSQTPASTSTLTPSTAIDPSNSGVGKMRPSKEFIPSEACFHKFLTHEPVGRHITNYSRGKELSAGPPDAVAEEAVFSAWSAQYRCMLLAGTLVRPNYKHNSNSVNFEPGFLGRNWVGLRSGRPGFGSRQGKMCVSSASFPSTVGWGSPPSSGHRR
jgi:hypothetical protein